MGVEGYSFNPLYNMFTLNKISFKNVFKMSVINKIKVSGTSFDIEDSNAQPLLVSGTNIKTINNESILGSGNITIQGGGGGGIDSGTVQTMIDESISGKADTSAVTAVQNSLSGYVTLDTDQNITNLKTFVNSDKGIHFKQVNNSSKIGFKLENSAATNNEVASFEYRPNTYIDGNNVQHPLLYFGHYRTNTLANAGIVQTMVGFRQFDQSNNASYHYLMPLPSDAKTPFSLNTGFKNFFAPLGFKVDTGGTMVTTDNTGVVDLSSYIGGGGGGTSTVELTQAEYDALVSGGTVVPNTFYIITDAQSVDINNYWTSAQTQSAINAATSGKVDTSAITSAVTSASTDSEIPTAKAVFDAIPTGGTGGSKAISAGTNISVTTGETADTVSCTLPISARTNSNIEYGSVNNTFSYNSSQSSKVNLNHLNGTGNTLTNSSSAISGLKNNFINGATNTLSMNGSGGNLSYNFINGDINQLTSGAGYKPSISYNFINGIRNTGDTTNYCIISGAFNEFKKSNQNLFGNYLICNNELETVFGQYNVSSSASTTFGNSGNTLFSVGNGTADNAKHNAFEIRQNGDIYANNGTSDVKLQDYLQIKLVKLTQSAYDALSPNYDSNTLYIIKD